MTARVSDEWSALQRATWRKGSAHPQRAVRPRRATRPALTFAALAAAPLIALYPSPGAHATPMLQRTVQPLGASAAASANSLELSGQVCDRATGQPIPGAQVGASGRRAVAGPDGSYNLTVQPATHLLVEASAAGYQTAGPIAIADGSGRRLTGRAGFSFCGDSGLTGMSASADGSLHLSSFSQLQAPGAELALSGTSSTPLESEAALQLPSGRVSLLPLQVQGISVSVTVPLTAGPGRYLLEINAAPGYALLKIPLFAGAPYSPPEAPPVYVADPPQADLQSMELRAVQGINALRVRAGLRPLQVDRRLQRESEAHSLDVANGGFIAQHGHVGSDGSTPGQRVQSAGVPFREVAEDIGMGGSLQEVLLGLMDSPAHRWAILGDFNLVGAGVARQGSQIVLTVDFVH